MKTIVGKKYITSDNSYSVNVSNPSKDVRLAGTLKPLTAPKEAIILTEPFKHEIKGYRTDSVSDFINVEYEGDIIRVLYYEGNIDACLKIRIKEDMDTVEKFKL